MKNSIAILLIGLAVLAAWAVYLFQAQDTLPSTHASDSRDQASEARAGSGPAPERSEADRPSEREPTEAELQALEARDEEDFEPDDIDVEESAPQNEPAAPVRATKRPPKAPAPEQARPPEDVY